MKFKRLAAILCGAAIFTSSICFATVSDDKISLGKLSPGISADELIAICGQPTSRDGDDWIYKTFKAEIERGIVEKISTRSESITTTDGVRVGQAAEILNLTYGKADKVDRDYDDTEYTYYNDSRTKKIEFKVVNGVITKITCEIKD